MACASALAEFLQGKTIKEAVMFKREELIENLGGLPEASTHASQLAIEALAKLIKSLGK